MAALIVINNVFSGKAGFYKTQHEHRRTPALVTTALSLTSKSLIWDGTKQRPATAINLHSSVGQGAVEYRLGQSRLMGNIFVSLAG